MSETFNISEYNVLYNFSKANELISRDFTRVNGQYLHLSTKLPVFIKKFMKIFNGYRKHFRDESTLSDEILKTFTDDTAVNDRSIFLAFYAIPLILRENFVNCGGKRFRPTLFMTREAFITVIATEATLAETRKSRKLNAISRNVTIQPYVVAVGTVTCITRYFVIFDDLMIPCTTCMEAIDLHFKMHDVFNLQYAAECRSVLIFIQKYFYALKYDGDLPVPQVETLIADIEK
uniref:(northern house mosquito) hypothetical protein n=2 Tax=Culex pipiens TaxID=7175 RepID=A0A8D8H5X5_CULPI